MNTTGTTYTTSTPRDKPISLAEMLSTVERLQAMRDPLADWMALQGFAPTAGGRLALPDTPAMRAEFGEGIRLPWYCSYSAVPAPTLFRDMVGQAMRDLAANRWQFKFGTDLQATAHKDIDD